MKKAILILCTIFIVGCSDDDATSTEPTSQDLTTESINVKTFEIVTITVNNLELTNSRYQGTFGNSEITLAKFDDKSLIFSVPEIEEGTHSLSFSLGSIEFNVTETQVSNTDELIQNVFDNFSTDIGDLDNNNPLIADEITNAQAYNAEVYSLYSSLTDEQKRQTAMFYDANKEIFKNFKNDVFSNLNASTTLSRTPQSNCPTNDFKSFYSCTAENLGNSAIALKNSSKEFLKILSLAGVSSYLAPASFGLSAVGTFLGLGTAAYIFITEVWPSFIQFSSSLKSFIGANWILTQATFSVVKDEFFSETESSLNITPDFRSIKSNDNEISQETSFFLTSLNELNSYWSQLTALFGDVIDYQETSENIEFDNNTDQVNITNISNSNVELETLNGQNVTFKTLSGDEDNFSFDITVNKEGFTQTKTVNATIQSNNSQVKWFEGTYTIGHWGDPTSQNYNCGEDYGNVGNFYILVGDLSIPDQIVVYYESIKSGLPNVYHQAYYQIQDINDPNDSSYNQFGVQWQEQIGNNIWRGFGLGGLEFSEDHLTIISPGDSGGIAKIEVPEGTGTSECNGNYLFIYDLQNINGSYVGDVPPASLNDSQIQIMNDVLNGVIDGHIEE